MKNARSRFSQVVVALAACAISACAASSPTVKRIDPPQKILFVGNSFTYYNNSLHNHLRRLMRAGEIGAEGQVRLRAMTISGGHLPEHRPALEAMVASEDWDAVVLQGHSLGPITAATAAAFREAAIWSDRVIDGFNADTVFFMTWAYTGKPEMTAPLNRSYTEIGNRTDSLVVPVGLAFARAGEEAPAIALRTADARHPTLAGSYLAACVFYAALFGESPQGLGYTAGLDDDTALALQTIAWRTVTEYYK